jgi:Ca2+-binding RTX toxin-like protein
MEGTPGNDTLIGTANTDTIYGRGGDDLIEAREARDILFGFGGDDVIVSGVDKRADEVRCGTGYDIAYLSGPDHSVLTNNHQCEEIHTFSSFDVIVNPGGTAG